MWIQEEEEKNRELMEVLTGIATKPDPLGVGQQIQKSLTDESIHEAVDKIIPFNPETPL